MTTNFTSGYMLNFAGLDASLGTAIKLDGKNARASGGNQLLRLKKGGDGFASNYEKMERLNLKMKLSLPENSGNGILTRFGIIGADTALTNDCDARLFSTSYRGLSLLSRFNQTNLYGYYLDRTGFPANDKFDKFTNGQGEHVRALYIAGADYSKSLDEDGQRIYMNMELGRSTEYLRGIFSQFSYHFPVDDMKFLANIQYRYSEKAGSLWNSGFPPPNARMWCWRCLPAAKSVSLMSNSGQWFDNNASNINVNFKAQIKDTEIATSYTYTAARSSGTGPNSNKFHYALVGNDCGSGTFWTSRKISSFNYHHENTWQVMMAYHFSDTLKGLSSSITHTYGNKISHRTGLRNEEETDLSIAYELPSRILKGLSIAVDNARYTSRQRKNNIYGTNGYRINDLRTYLTYRIAVL